MFESEKDFINELKPWMVFYFKDVEVSEFIPHYFVIINKDIINSPVLVLPVSTTQIKKRISFYEKCNLNKNCLVIVDPCNTNNILSRKSAFNCNQVKSKWILDLYELYIKWKANYEGLLPESIVKKLRLWVSLSNQVENRIKALV